MKLFLVLDTTTLILTALLSYLLVVETRFIAKHRWCFFTSRLILCAMILFSLLQLRHPATYLILINHVALLALLGLFYGFIFKLKAYLLPINTNKHQKKSHFYLGVKPMHCIKRSLKMP